VDAERLREIVSGHLDDVLTDARFSDLPGYSRGKVRDLYDLPDGRRILIATDRQSAFDQVLAAVPFKGQVLTAAARFWFGATGDLVRNHLREVPDPNVMVVERLKMLPVEIVVRDYLTGSTSTSIWPMYRDGQRRMYGLTFPDGLRRNEKLPQTILTPTTKADGTDGHDRPIAPAQIVERGLVGAAEWDAVHATALSLFARGRRIAAERGLILVDTKYEFGLDEDGRIALADEIHTPDSSRFWRADGYAERLEAGEDPEALDKDFLRRWITARCDPYREPIPPIPVETIVDFSLRYIEQLQTITGVDFVPLVGGAATARERLHACLRRYV
jgi:phosphoribosylaminoimidazole-succinocarboxamide synthase